ncbi:Prevent-host-death protein [Candidatus Thiomargarita nelsonii]|uniref:Prevent-host-death protein n=1 Tax=Candidatus Thiomargarita nelsonii TaxID=1003181 RepID=A0A176RX13_9GAMM|nr:Prevent-host-death protein [Candidatus Thiomargarita nelsonii]
MLAKTVDLIEAQKQFTEIVSLVQTGTEVILLANSQPVIRLMPIASTTQPPDAEDLGQRVLGLHEGQGWISEDFNEKLNTNWAS